MHRAQLDQKFTLFVACHADDDRRSRLIVALCPYHLPMNRDPKTGRRSWGRARAGEYPEIPALKRGAWVFIAWTMFGVAMTLVYLGVTIYWLNKPKWAAGAVIPTTIFQCIGAVRWVRWYRRVRETVKQPHGELCLHCLYPLAGLGESGRCPECGKAFDLANVRRVWSEFKV